MALKVINEQVLPDHVQRAYMWERPAGTCVCVRDDWLHDDAMRGNYEEAVAKLEAGVDPDAWGSETDYLGWPAILTATRRNRLTFIGTSLEFQN